MNKLMKLTLIIAVLFSTHISLSAQSPVKPFSHLGVGVEVGTTGVGFEVATPLHSMVNIRAGFAFLPFSYTTDFDVDYDDSALNRFTQQYGNQFGNYNLNDLDNSVDLKAESGLYNGKILVDFHPIRSSGFHLTAGLYIGRERIVSVEGYSETLKVLHEVNDVIRHNQSWGISPIETGVAIGDTYIESDASGKVDAGIKISKVKPYVGLGFGRAIPKSRVGFQFDLGCMFHGKPSVISKNAGVADLLNDELESEGFVKIMNKITVYPVISFKLTGRIL